MTAADAGPDLFQPLVGRGCAFLDFDGDGDLDVVLTANGGPARLLRNDNAHGQPLGPAGAGGRRQDVEPQRDRGRGDGRGRRADACGGTSPARRGYLSQSELPVTFGLGPAAKVDKVTVRWPGKDGGTRTWTDLEAGRVHPLRR